MRGCAQAVALVQAEGPLQQVGLVLGTAVTAALLVRSGKRFVATPDDPSGAGLHPRRNTAILSRHRPQSHL